MNITVGHFLTYSSTSFTSGYSTRNSNTPQIVETLPNFAKLWRFQGKTWLYCENTIRSTGNWYKIKMNLHILINRGRALLVIMRGPLQDLFKNKFILLTQSLVQLRVFWPSRSFVTPECFYKQPLNRSRWFFACITPRHTQKNVAIY